MDRINSYIVRYWFNMLYELALKATYIVRPTINLQMVYIHVHVPFSYWLYSPLPVIWCNEDIKQILLEAT
jgi:hypothetical protein